MPSAKGPRRIVRDPVPCRPHTFELISELERLRKELDRLEDDNRQLLAAANMYREAANTLLAQRPKLFDLATHRDVREAAD